MASGPADDGGQEGSGLGKTRELPFPAMTTDSRHVILVHAAGGVEKEGGQVEAVDGQEAGERAFVEDSPQRCGVDDRGM